MFLADLFSCVRVRIHARKDHISCTMQNWNRVCTNHSIVHRQSPKQSAEKTQQRHTRRVRVKEQNCLYRFLNSTNLLSCSDCYDRQRHTTRRVQTRSPQAAQTTIPNFSKVDSLESKRLYTHQSCVDFSLTSTWHLRDESSVQSYRTFYCSFMATVFHL